MLPVIAGAVARVALGSTLRGTAYRGVIASQGIRVGAVGQKMQQGFGQMGKGFTDMGQGFKSLTSVSVESYGIDDLANMFEDIGKVPKVYLGQSVKRGATIVRKEMRQQIAKGGSVQSGALIKSVVIERNKKLSKGTGKVAFDIGVLDGVNFQRPITPEGLGTRGGGKTPYAFYPASVNYGFHVKSKQKTEGKHYREKTIDAVGDDVAAFIVDDMVKRLDKAINNGKLQTKDRT